MQQAAPFLCIFVRLRAAAIKPSVAVSVFTPKQVAMSYSARKHKNPALGSCLPIKHIYTMISMRIP